MLGSVCCERSFAPDSCESGESDNQEPHISRKVRHCSELQTYKEDVLYCLTACSSSIGEG